MKNTLRYLVMVIVTLAGCEFFSGPGVSTRDVPLQGTTWKLAAFEPAGSIPFPIPHDERYVITFESDTSFTGNTTVNTYGGPCETDNRTKRLVIPYFISTRAYGGPNETRYYAALREAVRFSATTDGRTKRLRIYHGTGTDALSFTGE